MRRLPFAIALLLTTALLTACSTTPNAPPEDPYEATNRDIFDFNMKLDRSVLKPVAKGYVWAVPERARTGVHNALGNLNEPVVFANQLFQAHFENAGITVGRFVVNSSFGIGGLVDVGSTIGLPSQDTDFGVTLGVWGVGEGPYLMLPLLGPAPPRDLGGMVVDSFMDPVTYVSFPGKYYYIGGRAVLKVLDMRSRNLDTLDEIERTSLDFYAATRSLYLQNREAQVRGDNTGADTPDDPVSPENPAPRP